MRASWDRAKYADTGEYALERAYHSRQALSSTRYPKTCAGSSGATLLALASDSLPRNTLRRHTGRDALLVGQRIDLRQRVAHTVRDVIQGLLLRPAQHLAPNQIDRPTAIDHEIRRIDDVALAQAFHILRRGKLIVGRADDRAAAQPRDGLAV